MFSSQYKWIYEDVVDRILDGGVALDSHLRCLGTGAQFAVDQGRLIVIQEDPGSESSDHDVREKTSVVRVVNDP